MGVRASDLEATAIAEAARLGAAFTTHLRGCYTCTRARKINRPERSCDQGWELVKALHRQRQLVGKLRSDRKNRARAQDKLF